MALTQHAWQRRLHDFELQSESLDNDIREHPWNEVKETWSGTPKGQSLCRLAQECWFDTVAWWSRTDIDESRNSVMAYATITVDFLNVLANDYVYRRNHTVPSVPLWDALDHAMDMPASWSQLLHALDRRRGDDAQVNGALDALERRLSLIALARAKSNYPLRDNANNATVWNDACELNNFWRDNDDAHDAQHQSLMLGLRQLPSSMAALYTYATTNALPERTTMFLLDNCTLDPENASQDAVLQPWCTWLATLENQPACWATVQRKWPDVARVIHVVQALDSGGSAQILHLYRQLPAPALAPMHDAAGLFDSMPQ